MCVWRKGIKKDEKEKKREVGRPSVHPSCKEKKKKREKKDHFLSIRQYSVRKFSPSVPFRPSVLKKRRYPNAMRMREMSIFFASSSLLTCFPFFLPVISSSLLSPFSFLPSPLSSLPKTSCSFPSHVFSFLPPLPRLTSWCGTHKDDRSQWWVGGRQIGRKKHPSEKRNKAVRILIK